MNERQPNRTNPDELIERINDVTADEERQRRLDDVGRVERGIMWAEQNGQTINHVTARVIASLLHEGQGTGLLAFATSGAIDKATLGPELTGAYIQDDTPDEVKTWIEQFGRYLDKYDDREPVHGWNSNHRFDPEQDEALCPTCGAHFGSRHTPECPYSHETESTEPVEVYVASLTDYNNGRLHGVWIDATLDADELQAAIEHMLRNSYYPDAEEWAIHDHSGFRGLHVGEWTRTEDVSTIAQGIEQHGEAFSVWMNHMDAGLTNVQETARQFEDHYLGHYESVEDYARSILDGGDYNRLIEEALSSLPEHLREHMHFDVEGYGRQLEHESTVIEWLDGVYVFSD